MSSASGPTNSQDRPSATLRPVLTMKPPKSTTSRKKQSTTRRSRSPPDNPTPIRGRETGLRKSTRQPVTSGQAEQDYKIPIDCPLPECKAYVIHQHPPSLQYCNPHPRNRVHHKGFADPVDDDDNVRDDELEGATGGDSLTTPNNGPTGGNQAETQENTQNNIANDKRAASILAAVGKNLKPEWRDLIAENEAMLGNVTGVPRSIAALASERGREFDGLLDNDDENSLINGGLENGSITTSDQPSIVTNQGPHDPSREVVQGPPPSEASTNRLPALDPTQEPTELPDSSTSPTAGKSGWLATPTPIIAGPLNTSNPDNDDDDVVSLAGSLHLDDEEDGLDQFTIDEIDKLFPKEDAAVSSADTPSQIPIGGPEATKAQDASPKFDPPPRPSLQNSMLNAFCESSHCPIMRPHYEGMYLENNDIPQSWNEDFGWSNPPAEVWEAWNRVQQELGEVEDFRLARGFARCHAWDGRSVAQRRRG